MKRIQSTLGCHIYYSLMHFIWGFKVVLAGQEFAKMVLQIYIHISRRKMYLCTIHILHESSGYDGTQH